MRSTLNKLAQHRFLRNVMTVATGVAMAQAISLLFTPFLTRLYGPEVFGVQGVFTSVVGLGLAISALGYPTAIVLPKADEDALSLARLSVYLAVAVSTLTGVLLVLWGRPFLSLLNAQLLADYIILIPLAMLFGVFGAALNQWLVRKEQFGLLARYAVVSAILLGAAKICMGHIQPSAMALILTNMIGGLAGTLLIYMGWRRMSKKTAVVTSARTSLAPSWVIAKRYADFPLLRTPQNLINAFSQTLPVLLLASFFGSASAGQYSVALSALGAPAALIGTSVMTVFYPRVTEAIRRQEDARRLIMRATYGMAGVGALPFLLVMVAGPFLFATVFGAEWTAAGQYAQWLAPWLFFQFVNKPAVSAIPALGLQKGLLVYEVFSTGTKMLALWIGFALFQSAYVAIAVFAVSGIIAYIVLIAWVISHSNGEREHFG